MIPKTDVILAAAGSSRRMGAAATQNKPYLLLRDKPVLAYSLDFFEQCPWVGRVVVVAAEQEVEFCRQQLVERRGYSKVAAVVAGGQERQDSIYCGLQALLHQPAAAPLIAVHDSARPFLQKELFVALCRTAATVGAAIPGVLVKDTIKQVNEQNHVQQTLPRATLRAIQTPQVFAFPELLSAYRQAAKEQFVATDDAMLFERYCGQVQVVDTDWDNLKITTPQDWEWAQYRMQKSVEQEDVQ